MSKTKRPTAEEIILYEKDPKTKIATITFNRPEYLNAPTSRRGCATPTWCVRRPSTTTSRCVVIRGVGDNLGSGADLPEFMEGIDEHRQAASRTEIGGRTR